MCVLFISLIPWILDLERDQEALGSTPVVLPDNNISRRVVIKALRPVSHSRISLDSQSSLENRGPRTWQVVSGRTQPPLPLAVCQQISVETVAEQRDRVSEEDVIVENRAHVHRLSITCGDMPGGSCEVALGFVVVTTTQTESCCDNHPQVVVTSYTNPMRRKQDATLNPLRYTTRVLQAFLLTHNDV